MSQHDYNLANASGPAFRADANAALLAVVTQNAGSSAPSPSFANQVWYDSSTGFLMKRDNANTTWQTLFSLDTLGNFTFRPGANDRNAIQVRNAANQTVVVLRVDSTGNGRVFAEDLNSTTRVMLHGVTTGGKIYLDGDESTGKQVAPTLHLGGYSLAGLTGQSITIPAGAVSMQLNFRHVVQPGNASMIVQLGTSGGLVSTGYVGVSGSGAGTLSASNGFPFRMGLAGISGFGIMHFAIADAAAEPDPTWVSSHSGSFGSDWVAGGGAISLTNPLTTLRVLATSAFTTCVVTVQVRF